VVEIRFIASDVPSEPPGPSLQHSTTPSFHSPNVATSPKNVATHVATLTSKITRFYRHCCDVATSTGDHPPLPLLLVLVIFPGPFALTVQRPQLPRATATCSELLRVNSTFSSVGRASQRAADFSFFAPSPLCAFALNFASPPCNALTLQRFNGPQASPLITNHQLRITSPSPSLPVDFRAHPHSTPAISTNTFHFARGRPDRLRLGTSRLTIPLFPQKGLNLPVKPQAVINMSADVQIQRGPEDGH